MATAERTGCEKKKNYIYILFLLDCFFRCRVGSYPTYNLTNGLLIARPLFRIWGSVPCSKVPRQCAEVSSHLQKDSSSWDGLTWNRCHTHINIKSYRIMHTSTVYLNYKKSSHVFSSQNKVSLVMQKISLSSLPLSLKHTQLSSYPHQASDLAQIDHLKITKLKENQTMLQQECVLMSKKLVEDRVKKGAMSSALWVHKSSLLVISSLIRQSSLNIWVSTSAK